MPIRSTIPRLALAGLFVGLLVPTAAAQHDPVVDRRRAPIGLPPGQEPRVEHPFGTLREQAAEQQRWLDERMRTVLPALMRKHKVDMWVVPMREYNEDPVFTALAAPTTFAARRRTIYLFFDECAHPERPELTRGVVPCKVQRIALGGTSQGGVFEAVRSTTPAAGPAGSRTAPRAELWGDAQWQVLRQFVDARRPTTIAINTSRVFAFSDGLSSGELDGMRAALGPRWMTHVRPAEALPLELIATRVPGEDAMFARMTAEAWRIIGTAFSNEVIQPGVTRTDDVVWWMRQRVNDLGLGTWFHPSVEVQRHGATDAELGDDPIIQRGDVLHCDFGITALRLNTDTQHMGYVLREGETRVPASGHRRRRAAAGPHGQRDPSCLTGAHACRGDRRHRVFAPHRPARTRGWTAHRLVGLPRRRAGARRCPRRPEHVVLHRTTGDDTGAGVGRAARTVRAGRGRHPVCRRHAAVGVASADGVSPGEVTWDGGSGERARYRLPACGHPEHADQSGAQ
jgi:hypothetical protein